MRAIVIGATGLVGGLIVEELLRSSVVEELIVFVRKEISSAHPKLSQRVVDFERFDDWSHELIGDVLFSALGTTIQIAGSETAQYRVDHDYQLQIAKAARTNGIRSYVLVSSVGANPKSPFFYLKMKGDLERNVEALAFPSAAILRPGPLMGKRSRPRLGERVATFILKKIPDFFLSMSMRPVEAKKVAEVGVKAGLGPARGFHVLGPEKILEGV